jgi:general stress protein YciG
MKKPGKPRGFAVMDKKLVSEIARKGGKAAHAAGTAHEWTTEEARAAGRKGGRATYEKRTADAARAEEESTDEG